MTAWRVVWLGWLASIGWAVSIGLAVSIGWGVGLGAGQAMAWPIEWQEGGLVSDALGERSGYRPLIQGSTLAGWRGAVDSYEVVDGCIVCKPGMGGVIYHEEELTDFEVELEFLLPPGGNNGLAIRYPGSGHAATEGMCELQVLDDEAEKYATLDARQYHGSVYGMVAARRGHLRPSGEWNRQVVRVVGHAIWVELNGQVIVDADLSQVHEFKDGVAHPGKDRLSGYLGFCGHSDAVRFRNVMLRRLDPYRLSTFSVDATVPIGHRCMGILPRKVERIADPLWVHGCVVTGPQLPVAMVAVDWCEIRNESYDRWRDVIARAVGTTRERVLVSCLHQHDAPVIDEGAQRRLDEHDLSKELFDRAFHESVLQEVGVAAAESLSRSVAITQVGYGETRVERIASTRRIVREDGTVEFGRGSSSGGQRLYAEAEEGEIDPLLRTLSFWHGERCLAELHAYATHPMSYYGKGEVTSDFVGMARSFRQRRDGRVKQLYFTGCSGDVTAGKYNDGSEVARQELTERLMLGMERASNGTNRQAMTGVAFRSAKLKLPYATKGELQAESLLQVLADTQLPVERRILAAMGLSSWERSQRGHAIDLIAIDFGPVRWVQCPGEAFVGFGLAAAKKSSEPLMVIGYGECWPGYIPTPEAQREGFGEGWQWVSPEAGEVLREGLESLVSDEPR